MKTAAGPVTFQAIGFGARVAMHFESMRHANIRFRKDASATGELAAFEEDIRRGRTPSPGLHEGIRTLEIVATIYKQSGFPTH